MKCPRTLLANEGALGLTYFAVPPNRTGRASNYSRLSVIAAVDQSSGRQDSNPRPLVPQPDPPSGSESERSGTLPRERPGPLEGQTHAGVAASELGLGVAVAASRLKLHAALEISRGCSDSEGTSGRTFAAPPLRTNGHQRAIMASATTASAAPTDRTDDAVGRGTTTR